VRPLHWRVLRRLKHGVLLLLLAFTGCMVAGRLLMPMLATRKADIEALLSTSTGVKVTLGALQGDWFRFGPVIELADLRLQSAGRDLQQVRQAQAALDVYETLRQQRPVVERISLAGLELVLVETAPGVWTLAGFDPAGSASLDPLLDFLLETQEITLRDGRVRLRRFTGNEVVLDAAIINVQNRGGQHEAQVQLRIGAQAEPARLVAKLDGDPRQDFSARLWLDTSDLDLLALAPDVLPVTWQWQALAGRVQLWADLDQQGLQTAALVVSDLQASAQGADARVLALDHAAAELSLTASTGEDGDRRWDLRAQNLDFDWAGTPWQLPLLTVSNAGPTPAEWHVALAELDLALAQELLLGAVALPVEARSALATVAPRGRLRNLHVDTALDGSYPRGFRLQAGLADVAVQAWQQAPAASGLQGYVEADAEGGFAEILSTDLTLHLPRLFEQPWHYDHVSSRVDWRATPDHVQVQTALVELASAQIAGRLRFAVDNRRSPEGLWRNEFSLEIGVDRLDLALAPSYLPGLPRLAAANQWLREALQGGELFDSGFVVHTVGGRAEPALAVAEVLSWYRIRDGVLQFLPEWPAITGLVAGVVERGNNIDVLAVAGELAGLPLQTARAEIRPRAGVPALNAPLHLALRARADVPTGDGLDFLRNTPVRATLGDFFADWQADGQLRLDVGVGVDLAARDKPPVIDVRSRTAGSTLVLPSLSLRFTDIVGDVRYASRSGLSADALQAQLFGFPLSAGIETRASATAQQSIVIAGRGQGSVAGLRSWAELPLFLRTLSDDMRGPFDYDATLTVQPAVSGEGKTTSLRLASDLVGLTSTLPLPLAKAADEARPIDLELQFGDGSQTMHLRYHDWLNGTLLLDPAGIQRGQISVGPRNRTFTVREVDSSAPGLLVNGELPSFDVTEWEAFIDRLEQVGGEGRRAEEIIRLVDVKVGELVVPGQTLQQANVVVTHPEDRWLIDLRNDFMAGVITRHDDRSQPWQIALDYLRFPPRPTVTEENRDDEEVDPLQDVDPRELPAFDFATKELSFGQQNLGALSFEFRPTPRGASIGNLQVTSADSRITDQTGTYGASAEWRYQAGRHESSFEGLFAAGDLAKVLPVWGHDANIVSRTASFDSRLRWSGSPLHFSLKRSSGQVNLAIQDGRFVDIASGSTRLLGALNFDALVRRLQLDFSDIFSRGYSFDSITGLLDFTEGVVNTTSPLQIDGPASDLAIEGEINLQNETISADMQVQIPLGQNLSMVAGLLGAWPIAVSTYLASKIFQEQVEDFTTVIYRLEGPWAAPTAGFEPPEDYDPAAPPPAAAPKP
jgi:uncharacterized protein (TIGR02099 family)